MTHAKDKRDYYHVIVNSRGTGISQHGVELKTAPLGANIPEGASKRHAWKLDKFTC